MDDEINVLSDYDVGVLKSIIERERQRFTDPLRGGQNYEAHSAPETYIARSPCPDGIPALTPLNVNGTATGTGTDFSAKPGSADCDIYQPVYDSNNNLSLQKVTDFKKTIYNPHEYVVQGGAWILVTRDKFGFWWVAEIGDNVRRCSSFDATTTSSTTTTTPPPCSGTCKWTWSAATQTWTKSSSTCSTGCNCDAPQYCGSFDGECFYAACIAGEPRGAATCASTTTTTSTSSTTTTTTSPPGCTVGCTWRWYATLGRWVFTSGSCLPSCPCPSPVAPGVNDCDTQHTNCVVTPTTTTTQPPCAGNCRFLWNPDTSSWILLDNLCTTTALGCHCESPSFSGSSCGTVYTPCMRTTTTPPPGSTTTTPPPHTTTSTPPPGCGGGCRWRWSTASHKWSFLTRNCPFCDCAQPSFLGTEDCQTTDTACVTSTTTSTTSTSSTTTTTTCAPKNCADDQCTIQCWDYGGGVFRWNMVSQCPNVGCRCPGCIYIGVLCGSVGQIVDYPCFCGTQCTTSTPPPTTTTPAPTTTTTTTTPAITTTTTTTPPPCGTCSYTCSGGNWTVTSINCSGICVCQFLGACSGGGSTTAPCV